jgi:hypothetical protein
MQRISTSLVAACVAAALLVMAALARADDAAGSKAGRDDSNPPTQTLSVVSVQPDAMQIVGRGTNGEQKTVLLSPSTAIERHGPGPGGEAARGPMKLGDIAPGDRILVGGEQKGDVVAAKRIQVIGPADVGAGSPERRSGTEGGESDEGRTGSGSGIGSGPGPGVPESGSGTD